MPRADVGLETKVNKFIVAIDEFRREQRRVDVYLFIQFPFYIDDLCRS